MSDVPATRSLEAVLRDALAPTDQTRLVVGEYAGASTDPAYVNVIVGGETIRVPKALAAETGRAAYMIAAPGRMVALGAGGGGEQGPPGPEGPEGPAGPAGPAGPSPDISADANALSVAPTDPAQVQVEEDPENHFTFSFLIPKGAQGDTGAQGPAGGLLFAQRVYGNQEAYSPEFLGQANPYIFLNATQVMEILYTPPVDAWIEVVLNVGLVRKKDAAYHYLYAQIVMPSDADVDGVGSGSVYETQHSTVNQLGHRHVSRLFKCAAGHPYQFRGRLLGNAGGTWDYFRGQESLWMNVKAWPR